jgi:ABC-2 type transport system ATP-binding protein
MTGISAENYEILGSARMPEYAIRTEKLAKSYGDLKAVDEVSLRVRKGEIYAFLGLNGAGKTTTIRMLLGMIRPNAGYAEVLGQKVDGGSHELWKKVGCQVESAHAYPELTVFENLELHRRLRRMKDPKAVERVMEALALGRYAAVRAENLSFGNLQRLGLAKALLPEPELLILDEQAIGLDPLGVVEWRERLRRLVKKNGCTVFLSSHLLGEVDRLADRIGIIHHGKLVLEDSAASMRQKRQHSLLVRARPLSKAKKILKAAGYKVRPAENACLRMSAAKALSHAEQISVLLVKAGLPPSRLEKEEEDLEKQFMRLIGLDGVTHD